MTYKLSTLFLVVLCQLLSFPVAFANDIQVEQIVKSTKSWDGTQLPHYAKGQPEVTILKITIPPGGEVPWHHHPIINAGVLTKGQLTVWTKDGAELNMQVGDPIIEVVNKVHRGLNTGSTPAEIIVFYAGVVGSELAIKH